MATKSSRPRFFIDCWNTRAEPSQLVVLVGGSTRSATCFTRAVAAPSDTPGRRPKETDTDGSCPEWLIVCGPTVSLNRTTDSSGTSEPEGVRNATFCSDSAACWYLGSSSMSTRYCEVSP